MSTQRVRIEFLSRGARRVRDSIRNIGTSSRQAGDSANFLRDAVRLIGTTVVLRSLFRMTSEMQQLSIRVGLVTNDTQELNAVMSRLGEVARNTFTSLQMVTELYVRMSLQARNLGITHGELLNITENLATAIFLSGAQSREANNAIIQLSQGMSAGTLQGRELLSVMLQLPLVADEIADSLGVTRDELRELGRQGKVDSEVILTSFEDLSDDLKKAMEDAIPPLDRAFQVLRDQFVLLLGSFNESIPLISAISTLLLVMADNVEIVGAALGVAAITGALAMFGAWRVAVLEAATAKGALAAATTLWAKAQVLANAALSASPLITIVAAMAAAVAIVIALVAAYRALRRWLGFAADEQDRLNDAQIAGARVATAEVTFAIAQRIGQEERLARAQAAGGEQAQRMLRAELNLRRELASQNAQLSEEETESLVRRARALVLLRQQAELEADILQQEQEARDRRLTRGAPELEQELRRMQLELTRAAREADTGGRDIVRLGEEIRLLKQRITALRIEDFRHDLEETTRSINRQADALSRSDGPMSDFIEQWQEAQDVFGDDVPEELRLAFFELETALRNLDMQEQFADARDEAIQLRDQLFEQSRALHDSADGLDDMLRRADSLEQVLGEDSGIVRGIRRMVDDIRSEQSLIALEEISDELDTQLAAMSAATELRAEERQLMELQADLGRDLTNEEQKLVDLIRERVRMLNEEERAQAVEQRLEQLRRGVDLSRLQATADADSVALAQFKMQLASRQIELTEDEEDAARQLLSTQRELNAEARVRQNILGDQQAAAENLAATQRLIARGELEGAQAASALRQARIAMLAEETDMLSGLERGILSVTEQWSDFAAMSEQVVTNAFQGMEDALVDFVQTGELNFSRMVDQMLADLTRLLTRMLLIRGLEAATGSPLGAVGARATGGPVSGGSPFVVGERGPELFVPRQQGTIVPNEESGGRGSVTVVNVTDPDEVAAALNDPENQEIVVNTISRNRRTIKKVLGIR